MPLTNSMFSTVAIIPCKRAATANNTRQSSPGVSELLLEPAAAKASPRPSCPIQSFQQSCRKGMYKANPLTIFCSVWHAMHWAKNGVTVFITHVPLYTIFPRKAFFTDRTGPTHVNSMKVKLKLTKSGMLHIYTDCATNTKCCFHHKSFVSPPPPPQFFCFHGHHHHHNSFGFLSTTTTTITILLFSSPPPPPPPPPQFFCFHHQIKDCVVLALAHFITMSRVSKEQWRFP